MKTFFALVLPLLFGSLSVSASSVMIAIPTGSDCDPQPQGCFGSVVTSTQIADREVTNESYATFLNDVAASDPHGLYNPSMSDESNHGGITRTGESGSYQYAPIPGRENHPVNYVGWYDAARYINWLTTGGTETGAYDLTEQTPTRMAGATYFLPSEDEWYRAAYRSELDWLDWPAGSNDPTTCSLPTSDPNHARCFAFLVPPSVEATGSYPNSRSPIGAYDMGGNVWEWNEAIGPDGKRGLRAGSAFSELGRLESSFRHVDLKPETEIAGIGFRVAPEPDHSFWFGVALLVLLRRRTRDAWLSRRQ
jgi:formylglycine-generating enzyme required for sulfatase activity